jgi:hypothetical protein
MPTGVAVIKQEGKIVLAGNLSCFRISTVRPPVRLNSLVEAQMPLTLAPLRLLSTVASLKNV